MNVLQQLQAGIRVEFNESGRFLRILASEQQDKITVQFYRNGALISEALQVGRGFSETMEDGNFDSYAVTSSVTQNVNIVTRAGSRILYDTPPVGDVNILSLPPVTIANPDAQKKYFQYGASFKSSNPLAANTPETIFTAAANVNGAILHRAGAYGQDTLGNGYVSFIAKATAPTGLTDGDVIADGNLGGVVAGQYKVSCSVDSPVFIPAGKGLFVIRNQVEVTGVRSALYTLL